MTTEPRNLDLKQQKEHLTRLVRQGQYQDARQFARDMKHPKLNEVLRLIHEVEQHRNEIVTEEIRIPTEIKRPQKIIDDVNKPLPSDFPVHPNRVMRNRYGWRFGVWLLAGILGLRSFRLFQNYVKMEHRMYAIVFGIVYILIVGIFFAALINLYNVLTTPPVNVAMLGMSLIGVLILPLSPYAFAIVQKPVFKRWHEEFHRQRE